MSFLSRVSCSIRIVEGVRGYDMSAIAISVAAVDHLDMADG